MLARLLKGSGTAGRVVDSDIVGPQFETLFRQIVEQ